MLSRISEICFLLRSNRCEEQRNKFSHYDKLELLALFVCGLFRMNDSLYNNNLSLVNIEDVPLSLFLAFFSLFSRTF